jgi:hypothetical protein
MDPTDAERNRSGPPGHRRDVTTRGVLEVVVRLVAHISPPARRLGSALSSSTTCGS